MILDIVAWIVSILFILIFVAPALYLLIDVLKAIFPLIIAVLVLYTMCSLAEWAFTRTGINHKIKELSNETR